MGKYLREFQTHADYEAAKSSLILPNVSLCDDAMEVHYNKFVDYNGHEYVDLGLPSGTKWATMNVGATGVTDYGNYYQYGKGADPYAVTSGQSNYAGTEDPLAISADTAAQVWGGEWHMPTTAQCQELISNTTSGWVTTYGGVSVTGATFTAQNGNVLFIPAAGYWVNDSLSSVGEFGYVWNSTPSYEYAGRLFYISNTDVMVVGDHRSKGLSIRGVVG